jgi:phage-related protein
VLDLAYLGVTLMEMAGVPLDASTFERMSLRDVCNGRFHSCKARRMVDGYIGKLVASGLLVSF